MNRFLAPEVAHMKRVFAWLHSHGIFHHSTPADRFIKIRTTVEKAEKLLSTKFYEIEHQATSYKVYRSIERYQVPRAIAEVIQVVGGVIRFPSK